MSELSNKKKLMIIPVIFVLLFIIPLFSGCVEKNILVITGEPEKLDKIVLICGWTFKFIPGRSQKNLSFEYIFAFDTSYHEDCRDYDKFFYTELMYGYIFDYWIWNDELEPGVTYHYRAVVHETKNDEWFQGKDASFKF